MVRQSQNDIPAEFYHRNGRLRTYDEAQFIQLKALNGLCKMLNYKPIVNRPFTDEEEAYIFLSFLTLRNKESTPLQKSACISLLDLIAENWRLYVPVDILRIAVDRTSPIMYKWRKDCLKRDNYTCVECQSNSNLTVHHICSWADFPELRADVTNGKTLCASCHHKEHPEMGIGMFTKSN